MSLYNLLNGVTPATFFILPMLGKHPEEYPRFRDCFTADPEHPEYDNHIIVYTRTGGGNREDYQKENDEMTKHPNYVTDYDDEFDSTFACWVFSIPDKWKADHKLIENDQVLSISREYQEEIKRVFPKLTEQFDQLFAKEI